MNRNILQRVMDSECGCGYLQEMAADPEVPIKFNSQLNEYYFAYGEKLEGKLIIWHCPMCGGKAPHSSRGNLFAVVGSVELSRLHSLTAKLKTVDEVLAVLGKPDREDDPGISITKPEKGDKPPVTKFYRTLTYTNCSDTANVTVSVHPDNRVEFSFSGKYVGPKVQASGDNPI